MVLNFNTIVRIGLLPQLKLLVDRTTNCRKNHILRNYKMYKLEFGIINGKYVDLIIHTRTAITRLKTSSNILDIQGGRHTVRRTPINDCLCCACKLIEDEAHFWTTCEQCKDLRKSFYKTVAYRLNYFPLLNYHDILNRYFLVMNDDLYILA